MKLKLADDLSLPADEAVTQKYGDVSKLLARLVAATDVDANGCWIWLQSTRNGYGQVSVGGVNHYTHRLFYELFVGIIPNGQEVCHRCDVKPCNNPEHFFLGSQSENLADMRAKGRGSNPPIQRGASHHATPLSDAQVVRIRQLAASGSKQRDIAALFGCCQATVSSIVRREYRSDAK